MILNASTREFVATCAVSLLIVQLLAEYDAKTAADNEKADLIKQMQINHAQELSAFKSDSKKLSQKEVCLRFLSHAHV